MATAKRPRKITTRTRDEAEALRHTYVKNERRTPANREYGIHHWSGRYGTGVRASEVKAGEAATDGDDLLCRVRFPVQHRFRAYLCSTDAACESTRVLVGSFHTLRAAHDAYLCFHTVANGCGPFRIKNGSYGSSGKTDPCVSMPELEKKRCRHFLDKAAFETTCAPCAMVLVDTTGSVVKCWQVSPRADAYKDMEEDGTKSGK